MTNLSQEKIIFHLSELRKIKNLTQLDIARSLNKPQSFVSKYESKERNLDIIELSEVCNVLNISLMDFLKLVTNDKKLDSIFHLWNITEYNLSKIVQENPSLKGMIFGYVAEQKFHDIYLNNPNILSVIKDDDHNRKNKGDRRINYKGKEVIIEVKSLQSSMVKKIGIDAWEGKSQVDGSDRRSISFDDGTKLDTTLLLKGEFDLLAINCFAFGDRWRFVFAKNQDLPTSIYKKYTPLQQEKLLASLVKVTWPPEPPFDTNFIKVLDEIIASK